MKVDTWYQCLGDGDYKYILLKQMTFITRIRPSTTITFPPDLMLVNLDQVGNLEIQKSYTWNGATAFPDLRSMMRATLAHDALYQLIREKILERRWRGEADRLLRDICISDAMATPLAQAIYFAVRIFGRYRV